MTEVELPREERLRWLLGQCAGLHAGGTEPVSGLVLPTAEFFPDVFDGSLGAVRRLLKRVVKLAGLSDVPIRLQVPEPEEGALTSGGGCKSGACSAPPKTTKTARIHAHDDGYDVTILPAEVKDPTVLTTAMVRAVSHVFLREADLFKPFAGDSEAGVDLAGVFLGFGVVLSNASYIFKKG